MLIQMAAKSIPISTSGEATSVPVHADRPPEPYRCRHSHAYSPTLQRQLADHSHLHLSQNGVDMAVGEIIAKYDIGGPIQRHVTPEEVVAHVLNRSLDGIGRPVLQSSSTALASTAWLQIQAARDVAQPTAHTVNSRVTAKRGGATRMVRFELTDGVSTMIGVELTPLPFDLSQIIPGTKMMVHAGTKIVAGVLLLTRSSVGTLQGRVDSLAAGHALQSSAGARSTHPLVAGQPAPPAFRPFAERHIAEAELAHEREVQRAREIQESVALAASAPMKLMPPLPVEDTAAAIKPRAPAPSLAAKPHASISSARTQIELESEFVAQEKSKKDALNNRPRPSSSSAGTPTPSAVSSFRTLLAVSIGSTLSFSAQVVDLQLYPPRPPSTDFFLSLTLSDAFGMRANAIAAGTLFHALFGAQEQFRAAMATPQTRERIQARLKEVKAKICTRAFHDVQLLIQPAPDANANDQRRFIANTIGKIGQLII